MRKNQNVIHIRILPTEPIFTNINPRKNRAPRNKSIPQIFASGRSEKKFSIQIENADGSSGIIGSVLYDWCMTGVS